MSSYKNFGIRVKIVIGFVIILILALIIALLGILQLKDLYEADKEMYSGNTVPMGYLAVMYDSLGAEHISLNNMVIFRRTDTQFAAAEAESLKEKEALFAANLENYRKTIPTDDAAELAIYNSIYSDYNGAFATAKANVISALETGSEAAISDAVKEMDNMGSQVFDYIDEAFSHNEEQASDKVANNADVYKSGYRTIILFVILALVFGYVSCTVISKTIREPIILMKDVMNKFGDTGDLNFDESTMSKIRAESHFKSEAGQMSRSFLEMMEGITNKADAIERVAAGDLTPVIELQSASDTLGNSVKKLLDNLNNKFADISQATIQVATGAGQMSTGAQSLAQASTEQASSVENLSRSVNNVAEKTRENTSRADQAANLANTIKGNAEDGAQQMERLTEAVTKINESSQAIGSVIQVIESIAFQTNILALNAAVEAARAGQHGKGFAVVAEEVRSLAGKSASAASDTGTLIADSIEKAKLGAKIAEETAQALSKIVQGINESAVIMSDIAKSSDEQNTAIDDINQAINQVTLVVQQNSAIAQESAAASEEISKQSTSLQELIDTFELSNSVKKLNRQAEPRYINSSSLDFGKY